MAFTPIKTALPIEEVAEYLSIDPAHFSQATAEPVAHRFCGSNCGDLWVTYSWGSRTGLSRDALARATAQAEIEVGRYLGKPLTPRQEGRSFQIYPSKQPCFFSGMRFKIGEHLADYHPFVPQLLGSASFAGGELNFESTWGNGWDDIVRLVFEIALGENETLTEDAIVFYAGGRFGEQVGALRNAIAIDVEEVAPRLWRVEAVFHCWDLIDPRYQLQPAPEPHQYTVINLTTPDYWIESIEVGVMRPQLALPTATFFYEATSCCSRSDCQFCRSQVEEVTGVWRNDGPDHVYAWPATWDEASQSWLEEEPVPCQCMRWPSSVHITWWDSYCPPTPRSELCDEVKEAVALLAGARVTVNNCDCDCGKDQWFRELQVDTAKVVGAGRYVTPKRLNSYFGTLQGEQMAYDRLQALLPIEQLMVSHGSH